MWEVVDISSIALGFVFGVGVSLGVWYLLHWRDL